MVEKLDTPTSNTREEIDRVRKRVNQLIDLMGDASEIGGLDAASVTTSTPEVGGLDSSA